MDVGCLECGDAGASRKSRLHLDLPEYDYGLLAGELQVEPDPDLDAVRFSVGLPAEEIEFVMSCFATVDLVMRLVGALHRLNAEDQP